MRDRAKQRRHQSFLELRSRLHCEWNPACGTKHVTNTACRRQDFQFFPPKLAELQERELAVYKVCRHRSWYYNLLTPLIQRLNEIPATVREPQGEDDTPEKLEAERLAAQEFIDTGKFQFGVHTIFSLISGM